MTKAQIEQELEELRRLHPEMLEEMSNGLEEGEHPILQRGLGAAIAARISSKGYSNSPLATLKRLSPNCNKPREQKIDRLTPHHTAGVLSVESALEWFAKTSTRASCNYIVGNDGRIGLCVEECNRAWTSSSRANDNRAITFEVCNSGWKADGWPISAKSFEALVALCTDICKRYGKKKLLWIADRDKALAYEPKADEMILTKHEWFNNTECPGPSLGAKFPELATRVTYNLTSKEDDEDMVRFKTVEEMPKWAQKDIQKLVDLGYLKGKGGDLGLDLTEDMARILIINGRMNGILEV